MQVNSASPDCVHAVDQPARGASPRGTSEGPDNCASLPSHDHAQHAVELAEIGVLYQVVDVATPAYGPGGHLASEQVGAGHVSNIIRAKYLTLPKGRSRLERTRHSWLSCRGLNERLMRPRATAGSWRCRRRSARSCRTARGKSPGSGRLRSKPQPPKRKFVIVKARHTLPPASGNLEAAFAGPSSSRTRSTPSATGSLTMRSASFQPPARKGGLRYVGRQATFASRTRMPLAIRSETETRPTRNSRSKPPVTTVGLPAAPGSRVQASCRARRTWRHRRRTRTAFRRFGPR